MPSPPRPWRRFLERQNDDPVKIVGVALITAVASAALVSTTSVLLQPQQQANLEAERAARMAAMLDTLPGLRDLMEEAGVTALETRHVDLASGSFVETPEGYDFAAATSDPERSTALSPEEDVAGLGRRPDVAPVHLLERDGELALIVLPVMGAGYASTIRAMLALEPDLATVAALSIVEQAETPGLGARIEDPAWLAQWPGKQLTDEEGRIAIALVKGGAEGPYEVDAISGATRTSNGVGAMLQFWMGSLGYGPLLDRLDREGL